VFGWGVYLKLLAFDVRWSGALGGNSSEIHSKIIQNPS
jgi:hypothetical protein